jgi:hypothetical protein
VSDQPIGWIRMTVQGNWLTSNAIRPFVKLNGYTVESRYGVDVHPVAVVTIAVVLTFR